MAKMKGVGNHLKSCEAEGRDMLKIGLDCRIGDGMSLN
jgi:hypothetical protein